MRVRPGMLAMLTVVMVVVAVGAAPVTAEADEPGWQMRFGGVWIDPDVGFETSADSGEPIWADADDGLGFGLALEYRFSERLGVEFGAMRATPDVGLHADLGDQQLNLEDGLSVMPFTLGLNIHLTPNSPVDLYVSPMVGYLIYGDLTFSYQDERLEVDTDDELAWGAKVGIDVPVGDGPWSFNASATYLEADLEVSADGDDEPVDLGFDPLIISFGVGYRF